MPHYHYEKVRLRIKMGFLENKMEQDYFEVIERYACNGWRFVQAFAPSVGSYGSSRYVDLIFEREV